MLRDVHEGLQRDPPELCISLLMLREEHVGVSSVVAAKGQSRPRNSAQDSMSLNTTGAQTLQWMILSMVLSAVLDTSEVSL